MISGQIKDTLIEEITKVLIGEGVEGLKPVLELLFNTAMKIEREHFLKAGLHERRDGATRGCLEKLSSEERIVLTAG
jgi:hypothetical protein